LRPHVGAAGRLIVVFGCGGDRDSGKRGPMGQVVRRHGDVAIVTDDNPRTEDAAAIRREVMRGCPEATEIGDRAEAIRASFRDLRAGDIVVIAGKGHEQGQIVGERVLPFDDAVVAARAMAEIDR
jgi:UDP-N-acetylmuramoyl-L-alanyl-D-glutamate--2,6-diaminopimelate ligase